MKAERSEFYFGRIGAILPFIVFVGAVVYLCTKGNAYSSSCGGAAFLGALAAFFVMKDKKRYNELVLKGFTNSMLATMLIAFLLAGIIAKMISVWGVCDALVYVAAKAGADARIFPILIFFVGVIISSATGTSGGTMATTTPILLPLAVKFGCDPALVMGSIISGAMFGDNLAPVSDTTIASAVTQETSVPVVVRTRLIYCIIAGILSCILYIYFGYTTINPVSISANEVSANPKALLLLLVPVLIVTLMILKKGLVFSMLSGVVFGCVLAAVLGITNWDGIILSDGVLATGLANMMGVFPFFYFMYSLQEILHEGGVIDWFISKMLAFGNTPKKAEIAAGLMTCLGEVVISSPTVTIVTFGPITRTILKEQNIARYRGSNILDGFACALGGILPYSATFLTAVSYAQSSNCIEGMNTLSFIPYSFHCIFLLIIFWITILTGWGRKEDTSTNTSNYSVLDTL